MKIKILAILIALLPFGGCTDLNLNPLSEGSSDTWYSNEVEIEMSLYELYRDVFWKVDQNDWNDDWVRRGETNPITSGTITGEWSVIEDVWSLTYKAISRSNRLLEKLELLKDVLPEETLKKFIAEARFHRASQYSKLISHWGDVVYFDKSLDIKESFNLSKTDKSIILQTIYDDYDNAASFLPLSYGSSEKKRATKGAAFAMKARIALYMGDYETARDAAEACINLGQYQLYPDFGELFLSSTKNPVETIFGLPRSTELGVYFSDTKNYIPRTAGGFATNDPSWECFCSFLCTDGLPIDESPLFNPRLPFKNRDPRCTATIVEFQTAHLGINYQPHPDSLKCYNFNTGTYVKNNDNRANSTYASYNGLVYKKGVDEDWNDDFMAANDIIIMRYADVLLMYAEAKIELNEIDVSVLNSINQVRARAYKVNVSQIASYPAIQTTNQNELRKIVRIERRMEFVLEGTRYMDIIRWKLAEKVLNIPNYGMLDVTLLRKNVVKKGLWFFPATPEIDEDGIADFSVLFNTSLIKLLGNRTFDVSRQYLWPIPSKEILINPKLKQNLGY